MASISGFSFGNQNYGAFANMLCYQGGVGRPMFRAEFRKPLNRFKKTFPTNSSFWVFAIEYGYQQNFSDFAKEVYLNYKDRPAKVYNIYLAPPPPASTAYLKWSFDGKYESGRTITSPDVFYKLYRKPKAGGIYEYFAVVQDKEFYITSGASSYDYAINVKLFEVDGSHSYGNLEYYTP